MSSESDDDAVLAVRAKAKAAVSARAANKERVAVKAELEEGKPPGAKGPQGKDQQAKGQSKKPAKGKGSAQEEASPSGKESTASKKVKEEGKQPKEKKEYSMPGQTRDPPPETDSLRKFYTSLLQQRPESEMAKKWCLMHGLLSREVAEEYVSQLKPKAKPGPKSPGKVLNERSDKSDGAKKTRRPAEKAPAPKRQRKAVSPPPRKAKVEYSDEEPSNDDASGEDDDKPLGRARSKAAAKPAATGTGVRRAPLDRAFVDGGLSGSDDDDDLPLNQRAKK